MRQIKRIAIFFILFFISTIVFGAGTESQRKFIKGNLAEKTLAVKNAPSSEVAELSLNAIQFVVNYYPFLGQDKELAALAVAGVNILPAVYVNNLDNKGKSEISENLYKLYTYFSDESLKIAILTKIDSFKMPTEKFTILLNQQLRDTKIVPGKISWAKAIISILGKIGNAETFTILFSYVDKKEYAVCNSEIKQSASTLMETSISQLVEVIKQGNLSQCRKIFDLCKKNNQNSKNFKSEIAENVLSRTIYIAETSGFNEDVFSLQMDSFNSLVELKRTKAAKTAIDFFNVSRTRYETKKISANDFAKIILRLPTVAQMDCVEPLANYLQQINKAMENSREIPDEPVMLAIINSLGAVGDKMAFDALLSVTYFDYSENILNAARESLAGLKW